MTISAPAVQSLPLSFTQQYFLDVLVDEGFEPTWQHVVVSFEFPVELSGERVAEIADQVVERHPILATRLAYAGGAAYLAPARTAAQCEVLDLRDRGADEVDLVVSRFADRPFNLSEGPLWRIAFVRAAGRTLVTIVSHHLVSDAAAGWLIAKDVILPLFDTELDPAGPPFEEFVAWERERLSGGELDSRLDFWAAQLDGAQTRLVPELRPRRDEISATQMLPLPLAPEAGERLQVAAKLKRMTPLPLLAATVSGAIGRATGAQDVLSGVVSDIRGARFATTVGPFADVLLLRDRAVAGEDEQARLVRLRNAFFAGWQQHVPVALLRERFPQLGVRGDANPCDVLINLIPAPPAQDWYRIASICGEATPAMHFPRSRMPSPPRRFHAPLFLFLFMLVERLDGFVFAHQRPELAELNAAVATALAEEIAASLPAPGDAQAAVSSAASAP